MSDLSIRRALATLLISSGIPQANIAWENTTFDPENLDYYVAFYYLPVTDDAQGKAATDKVFQDGFCQISVFARLNANDYGEAYYNAIDILKAAFSSGLETSYNNQDVLILDTTNINPSESESWYQGGITVDYRAFKQRV